MRAAWRLASQPLCVAMVISTAWFTSAALESTCQAPARAPANATLLDSGLGIDHIGIFVRDLQETYRVYSEVLGFKMFPGGSFPDGVRGGGVLFEKNYLEVLTVDPATANGQALERVKFLDKHQGAVFLALTVSSVQQTTDNLRRRGFAIKTPTGGSMTPAGGTKPKAEFYRIVNLGKAVLPVETFFIEYLKTAVDKPDLNAASLAGYREHPNTAIGIRAVWVAVNSLEAATRSFEAIGLRAGRQVSCTYIQGSGREIEAGEGRILLLQADGRTGKVREFLRQRGEGIMGVTLEVRNLELARKLVEKQINAILIPYSGAYGRSILIANDLGRGIWIEMFQKSRSEPGR